jgi:cell division protein FtsB
MRHLRLVLWLLLFVSLATGTFFLHFLPARERVAEARVSLEDAQEDLGLTTAEQKQLETRLFNLQTNVDAVELGARAEYRLVRPGERLELISWRGGGESRSTAGFDAQP